MGDDAFDRLLLGLDWTFVAGEDHQLGAGSWLELREPGVLQVRAGLVRVRGTAGSRTDLAAGDLLFTPTGVRHEVHALAPTDLRLARLIADRALVMDQGRIVSEAVIDRLLTEPDHPTAQALVKAVL